MPPAAAGVAALLPWLTAHWHPAICLLVAPARPKLPPPSQPRLLPAQHRRRVPNQSLVHCANQPTLQEDQSDEVQEFEECRAHEEAVQRRVEALLGRWALLARVCGIG